MLRFSKIIVLLTLLFGGALTFQASAQANQLETMSANFNAAMKAASPLVPAEKPLSARTLYQRTPVYANLKKYSDNLQSQVRKKYHYKEQKRIVSARQTANRNLANSLTSIKNRSDSTVKRIDLLAKQRLDNIYNALGTDFFLRILVIEKKYADTTNEARRSRSALLKKAQTNTQTRIRRAKRQKAKIRKRNINRIRKNFQKRKTDLNNALNQKLQIALQNYHVENKLSNDIYNQRSIEASRAVTAERNAAVQALNKATQQEISQRQVLRQRIQKSLNYLTRNKIGRIGEANTKNHLAGNRQIKKTNQAQQRSKAAAKRKARAQARAKARAAKRKSV